MTRHPIVSPNIRMRHTLQLRAITLGLLSSFFIGLPTPATARENLSPPTQRGLKRGAATGDETLMSGRRRPLSAR
jgi:hypothetical protein